MAPGLDRSVLFAHVVVALWLTIVLIRSVRALAHGDRRTILFVQIVFYFFFGLPLLLDLTIGAPAFTYQRGFLLGQQDSTTNLIYLGYLAVVPLVFRVVGGPPRFDDTPLPAQQLRGWLRALAWAAMLALPFAIALAPAPAEYARYAAYVGNAPGANQSYQGIVSLIATLAVISGVLVLTAPNTLAPLRIATLPFLAMGVWIHGKRSIVALALLLTLYLLWTRGVLRGRRFVAVAFAAALALGVFSYAYQASLDRVVEGPMARDQTVTASPLYLNYRIDYGRDAVTRQTIYAELHPDELQVLEYRGQSVLFDVTFFVPRGIWPGKPYPYAVYATAAMFDIPPTYMGWGITTSWLEEAIANFGWFGMLLGPLLPALVCRVGDRRRSPFAGMLTVTIASLLLMLHVIAYMPLIGLWIVTMARGRTDLGATPTTGAGGAPVLRRPRR
ncbi:MAG: hypothetical protein IPL61_24980 [Myxococcales bacterium]|nr:hypothetical protein [Myxococcales bacterium]